MCAGERLRLAGYRPAGTWVGAGAGLRGAGGAVAAWRVRFAPVVRFCWGLAFASRPLYMFLLECLAFGLHLPCGSAGGLAFDHACHAFLLGCFAFGSRLPCGSVGVFCVRFTPVLRFYWSVLRSVHACLFSFDRKRETACGILHSYSAWVGIALVRSQRLCGYRALLVHFGLMRFFVAIPTELRRDAEMRGTE